MTEQNAGGVLPAGNGQATTDTVAKPRPWKPDPRNVRAMDRHIAKVYGREYVRRSRP